ncbi:hypothetical protein NDU88_003873 [Pleurodeles waltl]|uniref:Uncharacterized protein n=1 Tax=Pleurodeles waltl TaxID=8319 RepID=A0AAV7QBB2_PLEWA|nr:hypothetical protein NDU88_003873 [Pleurodeles waltl]
MDERVAQALRLLREAGRLDLLAAGADGGVGGRPALRAASQVVAAVVACSPRAAPKRRSGRWHSQYTYNPEGAPLSRRICELQTVLLHPCVGVCLGVRITS